MYCSNRPITAVHLKLLGRLDKCAVQVCVTVTTVDDVIFSYAALEFPNLETIAIFGNVNMNYCT
jgi:hypothetical protein